MSTDGSIPQPTNPSATLSSLPIEIKTLIVQFAFLQDEAFHLRRMNKNEFVCELAESCLEGNKWKGSSGNALFLLDTCFSSLCSPHLFEALHSEFTSSFRFKHLIARRRSHLFKQVIFDGEEKNQLRDLLSFTHTCTNINYMDLECTSARLLLGDLNDIGNSRDEELDEIHHSFKRLAGTISSLVLNSSSTLEISAILPLFPHLKRLVLSSVDFTCTSPEEEENVRILGLILSKFSLEHLELHSTVMLKIPHSWVELEWNSFITLNSLFIIAPEITSSCLQLIGKFSSSLRTLDINVTDLEIEPNFSFLKPFAVLSSLELSVCQDTVNPLTSLFLDSPIVILYLVVFNWDPPDQQRAIQASLCLLIPKIPSLKHLIISNRFILQEVSLRLTRICATSNIKLEFTQWTEIYISPEHQQDDWTFEPFDQLLYYEPALVSALKYGERKLLTLKKEKDVEGMKEMFENCKWLRASAAEMMD